MSHPSRQVPSLGEPSPELAGFPVWHVHAGTVLHRVTGEGWGPWWFASDGGGRFDLVPPRGTCYLADDPGTALLEALGPAFGGVVETETFAGRQLWSLALPVQCDAADGTHRSARRFGVTAELGTVLPYGLPRRWAVALASTGFGGLRYRARHDPAGGRCLALFGPAGERRWKTGRGTPLKGTVLAELLAACGLVAAARPTSAQLGPLLDTPAGLRFRQ